MKVLLLSMGEDQVYGIRILINTQVLSSLSFNTKNNYINTYFFFEMKKYRHVCFCETTERIDDGSNADVAVDQYHRYRVCESYLLAHKI